MHTKYTDKINDVLKKIIDGNLDGFQDSGSFKVRPGYGYDKFYLDRIDGSYDMSLQSLIHYIMYEEGIYKEMLSDKRFNDVKDVIEDSPEDIYYPEVEDDDSEQIQTTLDEIYGDCIEFVGKYLRDSGFDVEDTFEEYLEEEE